MATLNEAALSLKEWINRYAPIYRPHGMVGVGEGRIIVYMHCAKREWAGSNPTPQTYEGWPVKWNWRVGRPIAAEISSNNQREQ